MNLNRIFWSWKDSLKNESFLPQSKTFNNKAIRFFASFLFIALFSTIGVEAATYVVNTTADDESNGCSVGQCTLREAIEDANSSVLVSDTINFDPSVTGTITLDGNNLTIKSDITINGPGARNLTISANNLSRVFVVRGTLANSSPVANISGLTIADGNASVLMADGITLSGGGGILNTNGATLNLTEVTVRDNHTTTLGGGIATNAILLTHTRTNITRSTISGNTATTGGGGISNFAITLVSHSTTTITNSTITNNSALAEGGGISNTLGTVNLINNTISDNQSVVAGGGVASVAPVVLGITNLRNNIIARNSALLNTNLISSDLFGVLGSFSSQGNNLIGNNLSVEASFAANVDINGNPIPNANADIVGKLEAGFNIVDPRLGYLQNNGGPTNTRLLLTGSPALNKGNNCVNTSSCPSNNPPASLTTDQRGFSRILEAIIDIGPSEGVANASLIVTTLADNESDGCGVNECTLREAITAANIASDFDTIDFLPALNGTIVLLNGQLTISSNLAINGLGARVLGVGGNNANRVFLIAVPVAGGDFSVEINGLTITGGMAMPDGGLAGDGGGILNGALLGVATGRSTLRLHEVNISDNLATTFGGGIATALESETIITNSLISANKSNGTPFGGGDAGGGGLSNVGSATTVVANTTITNNETLMGAGGGILNSGGQIHLTNNTVSHNKSDTSGGGIANLSGPLIPIAGVINLRNTIIAANQSGNGAGGLLSSDLFGISGSFNSLGNNLIGNNANVGVDFEPSDFVGNTPLPNAKDDLCGSVSVDTQIIDPLLDVLQNNGGPTDSRLPSTASSVINAGNNCVTTNSCAVNPAGRNPHTALLYDQRGETAARQADSNTEIGATEVPLAPTAASVSLSGRVTDTRGRGISRAFIKLTDSRGNVTTRTTNQFGYFRFDNIPVGEIVVILPQHKQYVFSQQVLSVEENVSDLVFSAVPRSMIGSRRY